MAYEKDKDYQALINEAAASGDYRGAAQYEQQRNEKISGEGISGYSPTSNYAGWLDDTDYSTIIRDQISNNASSDDVQNTLTQRIQKASGTMGLSQYAYDDVYEAAMDYIKGGGSNSGFSYEGAPTYTSKYSEQIDELTQALLGRDPFSYDHAADPLYAQYKESYTREGDRAMQDTIGQVSARTGGLASSYAATAGTQANDYYMSRLADKIPELQQLAYSMYQDDYDTQYQNIQLLSALDQGDYNKYLGLLSQYNTDRGFDYGVYSDKKAYDYQLSRDKISDNRYDTEWEYGVGRDKISDNRYDTEWEYGVSQDEKADAMSRVADHIKHGGNYADLDAALIEASGYNPAELAALEVYFASQMPLGGGGSGGGGSRGGGGGSRGGGGSGSGIESLYEDMKSSGMPDVYLAAYYKQYGIAYSQISNVLKGYNDWAKGGGSGGGGGSGRFGDYSEAVAYMKKNGVDSARASAAMTKSEWNRRKASLQTYGQGSAEVREYGSYSDYLTAYVQYAIENS